MAGAGDQNAIAEAGCGAGASVRLRFLGRWIRAPFQGLRRPLAEAGGLAVCDGRSGAECGLPCPEGNHVKESRRRDDQSAGRERSEGKGAWLAIRHTLPDWRPPENFPDRREATFLVGALLPDRPPNGQAQQTTNSAGGGGLPISNREAQSWRHTVHPRRSATSSADCG